MGLSFGGLHYLFNLKSESGKDTPYENTASLKTEQGKRSSGELQVLYHLSDTEAQTWTDLPAHSSHLSTMLGLASFKLPRN